MDPIKRRRRWNSVSMWQVEGSGRSSVWTLIITASLIYVSRCILLFLDTLSLPGRRSPVSGDGQGDSWAPLGTDTSSLSVCLSVFMLTRERARHPRLTFRPRRTNEGRGWEGRGGTLFDPPAPLRLITLFYCCLYSCSCISLSLTLSLMCLLLLFHQFIYINNTIQR